MKKFLIALEVLILLLIGGGLLFIYSGIYNIAASEPHFPVVKWVFDTTMENSVRAHAEAVKLSPFYESASMEEGFRSYSEMCEMCHSAPGGEPSEIGKGLNPDPPELSDETEEWSPEEVYWILKHGIKMTGMPALGPTHSEKELWTITAFVKKLPNISPQEYQDLKSRIPPEGGHGHGGGEEGHVGEQNQESPPEERTL